MAASSSPKNEAARASSHAVAGRRRGRHAGPGGVPPGARLNRRSPGAFAPWPAALMAGAPLRDDAVDAMNDMSEPLAVRHSAAADPLWYKDAIIYQLHVKAFFDSNDDGIGDFEGLTRKLDYLQDLGVTALWLLPFYPSPLRDDGYDIADYRNVNPSYGTHDAISALRARGASRAACASSPSSSSTTPRTSIPGSSARARAKPGSRAAQLLRLERHRPEITRTRASSSSTPRSRTGRGTRWRRPITGTASIRTSPTSTSTTRGCSSAIARRHALLARHRRRRHAARRGSLSDRARRHDQREPARDARRC